VQVNVNATAMQQASIGAGYIQSILTDRISSFIYRTDAKTEQPLRVVIRKEFNANGEASWFTAIVALINQITTLTAVLTGAALIREREHGTLEHLLTLHINLFEIAISKVWANGLVILVAVAAPMIFVVRGLLDLPIAGSLGLFLFGVVLYLFSATALGLQALRASQ
jgi:ABC-2 type transport system permease protein